MSSKSPARVLKTSGPDFSFEKSYQGLVCGLDEVGRAPVAGPVVAACVFIPQENRRKKIWGKVNDSKVLSASVREELTEEIKIHALWAIAEASVEEIETINIVQASFLAMRRAFEICMSSPQLTLSSRRKPGSGTIIAQSDPGFRRDDNKRDDVVALIDGHIAPAFPCPVQTVIKGNSKSVSIAAASIIAKVYRDALMKKLGEACPHYGWDHNAGYPTRKHLTAIETHGLTPHHRKTFAPVRNFLEFGTIEPQMKLAI